MGTWGHIILIGGNRDLYTQVRAYLDALAACWTRFEPDSEICRLNAQVGGWVSVSPELFTLAQYSMAGWRLSSGAFNPFLAAEVVAQGYDRDFAALTPAPATEPRSTAQNRARVSSTAGVPMSIERSRRRLRLRPGAQLDSGGIGKGLAADLAALSALRGGATSVLVNLGGDVRCAGQTPRGGWRITIDDPWHRGQASDISIKLQHGALATSSPLHRRWQRDDGQVANHLIDPATGVSVNGKLAAVSVIARYGWQAEVLTKMAFFARHQLFVRQLRKYHAAAIITDQHSVRTQLR